MTVIVSIINAIAKITSMHVHHMGQGGLSNAGVSEWGGMPNPRVVSNRQGVWIHALCEKDGSKSLAQI